MKKDQKEIGVYFLYIFLVGTIKTFFPGVEPFEWLKANSFGNICEHFVTFNSRGPVLGIVRGPPEQIPMKGPSAGRPQKTGPIHPRTPWWGPYCGNLTPPPLPDLLG